MPRDNTGTNNDYCGTNNDYCGTNNDYCGTNNDYSAPTTTTTAPSTSTVASRPVVPGCTDIVRRTPAFEDGISDHELWIGRLVADQITDQQMLGVGWSVGDGLMIDGVVNIWAMNAADHVLHHATFARR
ncbi:MAG: hypothetical protein CM1200mP26_09490 [Acidimicrobiales bacterium]|nr:MAG: hypothetical protein CM1200mP26_09490 [Acidimicrobiales bacterium]